MGTGIVIVVIFVNGKGYKFLTDISIEEVLLASTFTVCDNKGKKKGRCTFNPNFIESIYAQQYTPELTPEQKDMMELFNHVADTKYNKR